MTDRPDLHTADHDQWDQGGYCNNLVVDDDGCGVVCGYREPKPDLSQKEMYTDVRTAYRLVGVNLVLDAYSTPYDHEYVKELDAEFDAWLESVKAGAWDEGFDAGERDVWMHETFNEPCIQNPYRKEE